MGVVVADHVTGEERVIRVQRGGEVVLCAGVFGSPQILHRSEGFGESRTGRSREAKSSCSFQDHTVLPFIAAGNWWALHGEPPAAAAGHGLPPNSVHGWVYLDESGKIIPNATDSPAPIGR